MQKSRNYFFFSLVDQGAVSGGNFLTIAIGAMLLPIHEQGKLIYIYSAYIGLVLFNSSAFFSTANIIRNEIGSWERYRHILLISQLKVVMLTSVAIPIGFLVFQKILEWEATTLDLILLSMCLFVQQIADFQRRSGYVFNHIKQSMLVSLWLYGTRILAILYYQPDSIFGFIVAMLLPALPIMVFEIANCLHGRQVFSDKTINKYLINFHLRLSKWSICNAPLKWVGLHMPIILVGALHSVEAAAVLGTVRAITTFANVLLELLETFVPAWLASKVLQGAHILKKSSMDLLVIGAGFWIFGAIIIWVFGDTVTTHLLGQDYAIYTPILYIIWLGNGIYFVGKAIGLHYRTKQNSLLELIGSIAGALALLLTFPLISLYGAWGGALCLVIVQIATVAGLFGYRSFIIMRP